jgi:hypothetical protein
MTGYVRKMIVPLAAGAALVVGAAAPASAQTTQIQDGLVNVAVGDIIVNDAVDVAAAAAVAANICGVQVGPVVALATDVDATGTAAAVCQNNDQNAGPVVIVN